MPDRPKLLWHSNAPWSPTGYGSQSALFLPHLKAHYDCAVSAFYGLEGNILPWNGIPVLPGLGQTHGNEAIQPHARRFFGDQRDGVVFTLMDVWVLDPNVWGALNTMSWVPVDHDPVPQPVASFFVESGAIPVAMSRFGEEQLRSVGLDPLYVPHGVDTEVYKPQDKTEARDAVGFPQDCFVVGMVAANKGNPSRKCFHEAFQAFKVLHHRHPDAMLYLHTELSGMFDGVNLPRLAHNVGIPSEAILFCDQYRAVHFPYEPAKVAQVYSAIDVLLQPSAGEGFGVPAIEAQACGTPVIASDFSAQPEVVGAGWLVEGRKVYTAIESWQFLPDIEDIAHSLCRAYGNPEQTRGHIAEKARAHALQYDVRHVLAEHMLPALEEGQARFSDREPLAVAA